MYLHQLTLKNIACFSELTLDFSRDGKPCPWVVLLGENGTGKSTILQMLALTLLGRDLIYQVASNIDWPRFVKDGEDAGQVDIILFPTKQDKKVGNQKQVQARFEMGSTTATGKTGLGQDDKFAPNDYNRLDNTLYSHDTTIGWFACGYGPWRRLSPPGSVPRSGAVLEKSRGKSQRFVTMFNSEIALTVVSDWLVDLEFRRLKAVEQSAQTEQAQQAAQSLRWAIEAIEKILPGVQFKEITAEGQVFVTDHGATVAIDQLSDGYRSTLAWVIDLVRRLIETFPKDDPLKAEGVVLVDEIALHLHPRWQRQIVEHIRQTFPHLQFIVTSHSPFVAQDMREEDKIIVLKKGERGVEAQEGDISVSNWRVDQILTSFLFDLDTTRNVTIGAMEQEYQQLLDRQTTDDFTPAEAQRLAQIKQWLDQHQAPIGDTPAENEVFDTATSLIDLLDKYISK